MTKKEGKNWEAFLMIVASCFLFGFLLAVVSFFEISEWHILEKNGVFGTGTVEKKKDHPDTSKLTTVVYFQVSGEKYIVGSKIGYKNLNDGDTLPIIYLIDNPNRSRIYAIKEKYLLLFWNYQGQ